MPHTIRACGLDWGGFLAAHKRLIGACVKRMLMRWPRDAM